MIKYRCRNIGESITLEKASHAGVDRFPSAGIPRIQLMNRFEALTVGQFCDSLHTSILGTGYSPCGGGSRLLIELYRAIIALYY